MYTSVSVYANNYHATHRFERTWRFCPETITK